MKFGPPLLPTERVLYEGRTPLRYVAAAVVAAFAYILSAVLLAEVLATAFWPLIRLAIVATSATLGKVGTWADKNEAPPDEPYFVQAIEHVGGLDAPDVPWSGEAALVVLCIGAVVAVVRGLTLERYTLTDQHIYTWRTGLNRRVHVVPLSHVTDLNARQSLAGRILGMWEVEVGTRGRSAEFLSHHTPAQLRYLAEHHELPPSPPRGLAATTAATPSDERPILDARPTPRALLLTFSMEMVFPVGLAIASDAVRDPTAGSVARIQLALALFIGVLIILAHIGFLHARYTVTSKAVTRTRGLLTRRVKTMPTATIADTELVQPFFGRILGYGTVVVTNESGEDMRFVGLTDPHAFKASIERARDERTISLEVAA